MTARANTGTSMEEFDVPTAYITSYSDSCCPPDVFCATNRTEGIYSASAPPAHDASERGATYRTDTENAGSSLGLLREMVEFGAGDVSCNCEDVVQLLRIV